MNSVSIQPSYSHTQCIWLLHFLPRKVFNARLHFLVCDYLEKFWEIIWENKDASHTYIINSITSPKNSLNFQQLVLLRGKAFAFQKLVFFFSELELMRQHKQVQHRSKQLSNWHPPKRENKAKQILRSKGLILLHVAVIQCVLRRHVKFARAGNVIKIGSDQLLQKQCKKAFF